MKKIYLALDKWCVKENILRRSLGSLLIKPFRVRLLGQTALIELKPKLKLFQTHDVDAYADFEYSVMKKFEELLKKTKKIYDRLSYEIWMPEETEYQTIFKGELLTVQIAKIEYILISKAKMDPTKNKTLLAEYLKKGPSQLFLKLAKKYGIKLEQFNGK
jgi:hypothetical protein